MTEFRKGDIVKFEATIVRVSPDGDVEMRVEQPDGDVFYTFSPSEAPALKLVKSALPDEPRRGSLVDYRGFKYVRQLDGWRRIGGFTGNIQADVIEWADFFAHEGQAPTVIA